MRLVSAPGVSRLVTVVRHPRPIGLGSFLGKCCPPTPYVGAWPPHTSEHGPDPGDRRLVARRELPHRRADRLLDNPLLTATDRPGRREAPPARALGHLPRAQPRLRALQRAHRRDRPRPALRVRPPDTRSRDERQRVARGHLAELYPDITPDPEACGSSSSSSRSPGASRRTRPPRRPARSTRAASSATRSPTRTAPRSTTPTSSWRASSATASRDRPAVRSWQAHTFLDPVSDGAVLPILNLNGWKIANPTILARIPDEDLTAYFRGLGYEPIVVDSARVDHDPFAVHALFDGRCAGPRHDRRHPGRRAGTGRARRGRAARPVPPTSGRAGR